MTKPRHLHDCDSCTFIGHTKELREDGLSGDVYLCGLNSIVLISRYSDDPPDYSCHDITLPTPVTLTPFL